jgi:hypothetical protein
MMMLLGFVYGVIWLRNYECIGEGEVTGMGDSRSILLCMPFWDDEGKSDIYCSSGNSHIAWFVVFRNEPLGEGK